jgi:predicted nucleic acid-binding protein
MAAPVKILIDLNIILDALQRREPFFADSARLLAHAELGHVTGLVAAHSWTTLFYLYAKDQSANRARVHLTDLLQFLAVATVDQAVIEQALNLPYRDFEDAIQMMAAVRAGADYLLTRNVQDYKAGPLPVLQPVEMLTLLEQ